MSGETAGAARLVTAAPAARVTAGAARRMAAVCLGVGFLAPLPALAQQQITLREAIEMAQKQGYQATAALATRDAARSQELAFFRRRLPQVSLNATAPSFQKTISPVIQPDGSTLFVPVQATTAQAGMTITQQLPFTGANLSISSSLQRYQRTGDNANLTWSSTPVQFRIEQPILRPNDMRWDEREQDVRLNVAERQYLEAREAIALSTSNAFFDFYIAKRTLAYQTANAATNDTLYNLNKGRLEIGKIGENDLLQSELALLRSRAALENARLDYERAAAAFRIAVNMPVGADIDVIIPAEIPLVDPDTSVAVAQALTNRAQVSQLELQAIQARRGIAEARLNGGPGAMISAGVGFNQTAPDMNLAYQDLLQSQNLTLGISIPVISWGARSANVQAARLQEKQVEATARAQREQLVQEAHFAALQVSQAKRNVALSAKSDTVAQKRFEVAYNRYVIGRIGIDNLYIAQNEMDQSVNQYLASLKAYWAAYYRLRQLTLYDFATDSVLR